MIFSLFATAVLILSILWLVTPLALRWSKLRNLTSDEPAKRQPALVHVAKHAADDPAVLRYAIEQLNDERDEVFRAIAFAIDSARQWRRPTIPDDAWLRWIDLLAQDPEPSGRTFAAQQLGMLHDLADEQRVRNMATSLLADEDDGVRLNALVAAAELTNKASASRPNWAELIAQTTGDANIEIARQAWLLSGLLGKATVTEAALRDMPLYVAHAAAWAEARQTVGTASVAWRMVRDDTASMELRATVAAALVDARGVAGADIAHVLPAPTVPTSLAEQVFVWRLLLAGEHGSDAPSTTTLRSYQQALIAADDETARAALLPLACAATYRLGDIRDDVSSLTPSERVMLSLALVESPQQTQPAEDLDVLGASSLVHVLAARNAEVVNVDLLANIMADDEATVRDLACIVAIQRLSDAELEAMIRRCLLDFDDDAKMAGAMLAGLTGLKPTAIAGPIGEVAAALPNVSPDDIRTWSDQQLLDVGLRRFDLLESRMQAEDVWHVKQVMRLALWMQGRLPEMDEHVESLLSRNDVPRTHVLLAMLHRGNRTAYEVLLAPRGEPGIDLLQLLSAQRWWYVLQNYLPADTPPLTLWADDDLQRMQITILRNWWLLHGDDTTPE